MPPSVVVFDVNETLLDIGSIAPLFADLFGSEGVLREWFGQLITYSMTVTLTGEYVDFSTLGQGVLRMVADIHGVDITENDAASLKSAMLTMPAHPDVAAGLTELRANGFRLVTLTNSPPSEGASPLENAGLAGFFEQQLTVDFCRAFKPAPAVYRHVCEVLDVAPGDCMMVAAHVWDLLGAQHVGFSSALITRPGNRPLPVGDQPTLVARDLRELAGKLASRPR
ncbi:haloacid dehalogenase, type II [Mycobacterium angelicum]|uniref:Haloacid dehalogenase, type II n=1 Tax=Mycobacterium angelicum TaxID=470074 RepID=A0A1X0A462_MYCAN|nr:haloacid dehalogenase type II [Mycobacterium angelicum]MCV7197974.1 haloacid dehalogenase type II [Mycobacterium angelicum]ORA24658.1 haloacid dehalogenase, type II [Mycobacterium angelicum]